MNFLDCTTKEGKKALAELYEKLTGKKWEKPTNVEVGMDLNEIKEFMESNRDIRRNK